MPSFPDEDRLARILGGLSIEDAAFLAERLQPAWRRRAAMLDCRDAAVIAAAVFFPDRRSTIVAKTLAQQYSRYLAAAWRHGNHLAELPDGVPRLRAALHRIAVANGGRSLSWRQILNILEGRRS